MEGDQPDHLGCPLGASETLRFSEGNLFVRVLENVRGRHVYLVQSTAFPANDNFMELLFWIDAREQHGLKALADIDAAVLEVSGGISIIPREQ